MLKKFLTISFGLALIFSCGGKKTSFDKLVQDAPDWVIKGSGAFKTGKGTAIYGVGVASYDPNPAMLRATVDGRARQDLAKILNTYVSSMLKDFMESHKDFTNPETSGSVQFVSNISKVVTDATLVGSTIIDRWTDREGNQYALANVSFEDVARSIKEKTTEAIQKEGIFLQAKANEAMDQLNQELERRRLNP
jgi:hypothetical protein